jgi:hypothetical protein
MSTTNPSTILPPTEGDRPVTNTSVTTTSTAAIDTGSTGSWYEFTTIGANVYIRFGTSAVGAATTANGGILVDGTTRSFFVPASAKFFRAITASGTATLSWYRAG